MSHTPYGYIIQNGESIIDTNAATQIRDLFRYYLSGLSLMAAAEKAGIKRYHATVAKMLTNEKYLGDEFYPQIIDKDFFEKAGAERLRRAQMLGRVHESKDNPPAILKMRFTAPPPKQFYDDPFMQAEYAYSLIESEVIEDGGQ